MPGKSNQLAVLNRVEIVFSMILNGCSNTQIFRFGSEKWNLSRRQLENYISSAKKRIIEINKTTLEQDRAWHVAQRKYLLNQAEKIDDLAESIRVQIECAKDLARVQGVYEDKITILSPEQEKAELDKAMEIHGVKFEEVKGESEYGD